MLSTMHFLKGVTFGLVLLSATLVSAAETHVYKFVSSRRLAVNGRDHLVIIAEAPTGGHPVRLVAPNSEQDKYSPAAALADAIKGFHAGQFIQAESRTEKNTIELDRVSSWSPRPGEETPHGYIYLHSGATDKPGDLLVALSKYGETIEVTVPAEPGPDGAPAPNRTIESELKAVQEGDVVWAELITGKMPSLETIVPWSEPLKGKLMRVAPADIDGQKGFAAEIATDSQPITALIPMKHENGKWIPNPRLLDAARKPSRGAEVLFRTRQDADKIWLIEIEPPPRQAAPVAQRNAPANPPLGIPVHPVGGAGSVPGVGGLPGGF